MKRYFQGTTIQLLVVVVSLISQCHSISFRLSPNTKRCFLDNAQKNELVTGEYSISDSPLLKTHIKVSHNTTTGLM